jgi:putative membrane protein
VPEHDMGGMGGMYVPALGPTLGRVIGLDVAHASPIAWLAVLLAVAYVVGLLRLRQRGVRWAPTRTASFLAGCVSLFWITPLLLLLGAPVTLALRALPASQGPSGMPRRLLLTGLHSRLGQAISSPLFTVPLFIASLYGVYFTPIFDDLMSTTPGHTFMLLHFLTTGMLFFGPILSIDPWPRRSGHAARMLELLLPAPFHAFFGVTVMMTNTELLKSFAQVPASWDVNPLFDQGSAGGIAWSFGEFPTVLVLAVVFFQWAKSEERSNRAVDRERDRAIARGESGDDPALIAYNERLRRMAAQNP